MTPFLIFILFASGIFILLRKFLGGKNNHMTKQYYEDRIGSLERALEDLVEQFDTGAEEYTITVIDPVEYNDVDEPLEIEAVVTETTQEAVENALRVLYNPDDDVYYQDYGSGEDLEEAA